jgi:hypothetical protein
LAATALSARSAHLDLDRHHGKPTQAHKHIEGEAREDPSLIETIAAPAHEHEPRDRLENSGGGGEEVIGDDHGPERRRDCNGLLLAAGPEEKEGDAGPGAEQDGGADASKPAPETREVAEAKLSGMSVSVPVSAQNRASVTCNKGTAKTHLAWSRSCTVAGEACSVSLKLFKGTPQTRANSAPGHRRSSPPRRYP